MKKFMKGCLITALVLFAAGAVLAVLGGSAKGSAAISQVVESVTGGRVHVNLGDISGWGVTIGDQVFENLTGMDEKYDISDASMFDGDFEIYKGEVSKYCPGAGIEKLEIQVGGCVLETKTSKDDSFYIEVEKAYKFQGYVEDNTLYIKASNGAKSWSRMGSCVITLYVPEGFYFEKAEVEMGAGVMKFSELCVKGETSLEVGAGQIVVDDVRSETLELSIGAGQIELKNMRLSELEAEIGMGELKAEGEILSSADVECSMGNVKLKVKGSEKDFNYYIECAMGNVDLGSDSYSGLAKEKTIENGASKEMSIECAMGNITVVFKK